MTPQNILTIAGSIALLIGLFGGGVKAKEIEIPKISIWARIFSSVVGVVLIGIAIRLPNPLPSVEPPTSTPISIAEPAPTQSQIIAASLTTAPPIYLTDTPIPKFAWTVYFEIEFKEGYWKPGNNSYQIVADCPDIEFLGDIDNRIEFSVDENAQLFPDTVVEFHFFGIPSPDNTEPSLSSINPNQRTKIILGYTNIRLEQATQAVNECQVRTIVNDKWTLQMSPIGPAPEN
ncbi:MAG: hypothetical protein EHM33_09970 [Chloroflexi bacterium]|nr:MAG: hypothetical protein EHM33_09970 [Chloroflexota bacterium]